jgi:hypothetical protein
MDLWKPHHSKEAFVLFRKPVVEARNSNEKVYFTQKVLTFLWGWSEVVLEKKITIISPAIITVNAGK